MPHKMLKSLKNRSTKSPSKESTHKHAAHPHAKVGSKPMGDSIWRGTAKTPKSMGPRDA